MIHSHVGKILPTLAIARRRGSRLPTFGEWIASVDLSPSSLKRYMATLRGRTRAHLGGRRSGRCALPSSAQADENAPPALGSGTRVAFGASRRELSGRRPYVGAPGVSGPLGEDATPLTVPAVRPKFAHYHPHDLRHRRIFALARPGRPGARTRRAGGSLEGVPFAGSLLPRHGAGRGCAEPCPKSANSSWSGRLGQRRSR